MAHYRILYACGQHTKAQCRCPGNAEPWGGKFETIEEHRCPVDGCPDSNGELRKAKAAEKLTMSDFREANKS